MLSGGGFEDGTGAWTVSRGQLEPVAAPVHGGSQAARLSGDSPQVHEVYQWLDAAPGQSYSFSGWVWLDDPNVARVYLRVLWFDQTGSTAGEVSSPWLTIGQPAYQSLSTGGEPAPAQARTARVGAVVVPQTGAPFQVYLDDLSFQGPPPVIQTPTPTPTAPPPSPGTPTPAPPPSPTPTPAGPAAPPSTAPSAVAAGPAVYPYLVNGGFEEVGEDGLPVGWDKVGGELSRTAAVHAEGAYAAALTSTTESTKWVYQTVAVEGGAYYRLEAQALNPDPAAEAFLRVSWYASRDGSGQAISSADSAAVAANSPAFQHLSAGPVAAPAQARSARVRLMLRPASAAPFAAYFDAVAFGQVPAAAPSLDRASASASGTDREASLSDEARAVLGSSAGPQAPANVRAPRPAAAESPASGGGAFPWPVALALAVPGAALATVVALEWRRRRLAAGDDRSL